MDSIAMILTALTAGAAAVGKVTVSEAVKDAYYGLKAIIQRRFVNKPDAELALTKASIIAAATPVPPIPGKSTVALAVTGVVGLSQTCNSPDRRVRRHDFFIAYATPDRRQAQDLCWLLQDHACEVFLDVKDLSPGELWPSALREALETSRAIVVLVSTHANDAFYQQEEVVRAIQLTRDKPRAHTVIPVILEKLPQGAVSMPYGMSSLQAQDATRPGGLKRVAAELVVWLKEHQLNAKQPKVADAMIEALTKHAETPEVWKAPLQEALTEIRADHDEAIIKAAQKLIALLNPSPTVSGKYHADIAGSVQGFVQGDHAQVTMTFTDKPPEP